LFASLLVASFGLEFGEKFSLLFLATFEKKFPSRSVWRACRKLLGRHGRVFSADRG
jgi:hypothetical protein